MRFANPNNDRPAKALKIARPAVEDSFVPVFGSCAVGFCGSIYFTSSFVSGTTGIVGSSGFGCGVGCGSGVG